MNLPPGARVRYRILTEKSRLGFGKYADLTVGDVMRLDETYIPFLYYNASMISFIDDILDSFQMSRIGKPGTSKENWDKWRSVFYGRMSDEEHLKFHSHLRSILKAKAVSAKVRAERYSNMTAGQRQADNLGRLGKIK